MDGCESPGQVKARISDSARDLGSQTRLLLEEGLQLFQAELVLSRQATWVVLLCALLFAPVAVGLWWLISGLIAYAVWVQSDIAAAAILTFGLLQLVVACSLWRSMKKAIEMISLRRSTRFSQQVWQRESAQTNEKAQKAENPPEDE